MGKRYAPNVKKQLLEVGSLQQEMTNGMLQVTRRDIQYTGFVLPSGMAKLVVEILLRGIIGAREVRAL